MTASSKLDRTTMLRAGSWAMFDFANTIYSFIVVTMYLPPLLKEITGNDFLMSFSNVFSMIIAGFTAPVLGALTDRSSKAKRWLILTTVICCLMCGALGLLVSPDSQPGLFRCIVIGLAFVIANFTYQIGLMFYNSFLPTLVPSTMQGKVSGLGVALGYAGVLAVIKPAGLIAKAGTWWVFAFGGLAFFAFALPMFLFVPERKPEKEQEISKDLIKKEIENFKHLIGSLKLNRNLLNAFLANFLAVDAVNTAIIFFTNFLLNGIFYDLPDEVKAAHTENQMLALTISAIIMSFVFGWLADRFGSKRAFLCAAIAMAGAAISGCLLPRGWLFYIIVTTLGGAGLAGVWTSGRKLFADITPAGQEGTYFGLYGLANKSSALGMIVFACITYFLPKLEILSEPRAYRAAFLFSVVTLAGALYFLKNVEIKPQITQIDTDKKLP